MVTHLVPLIPAARHALDERRRTSLWPDIWQLLDEVKDPEIPVVSLWELGVLQDVVYTDRGGGETVCVTLTPTYSGCPALQTMKADVQTLLHDNKYPNVEVTTRLTPVWTTEWLSHDTRVKLREYGIAPPDAIVKCPQCASTQVGLISEFGSTACKAMYRCRSCSEPFDYFKAL